jgi:hypothetical protein
VSPVLDRGDYISDVPAGTSRAKMAGEKNDNAHHDSSGVIRKDSQGSTTMESQNQ